MNDQITLEEDTKIIVSLSKYKELQEIDKIYSEACGGSFVLLYSDYGDMHAITKDELIIKEQKAFKEQVDALKKENKELKEKLEKSKSWF